MPQNAFFIEPFEAKRVRVESPRPFEEVQLNLRKVVGTTAISQRNIQGPDSAPTREQFEHAVQSQMGESGSGRVAWVVSPFRRTPARYRLAGRILAQAQAAGDGEERETRRQTCGRYKRYTAKRYSRCWGKVTTNDPILDLLERKCYNDWQCI